MKQIAVFLLIVLFVSGCGYTAEFSSIALGKNKYKVKILESSSRIVDNFFKSEYVYLINNSDKGTKSWVSSLSLLPYDEKEDGNPDLRQYLIDYFPNITLKSSGSNFFHLGESQDGHEHYMLVFTESNVAIYYVATM